MAGSIAAALSCRGNAAIHKGAEMAVEFITTRIDVGAFLWARTGALRAHATQVDPSEPFWFGLTDEQLAEVYPWEDWILAHSLVGEPAEGTVENDMFAGVRSAAAAHR